MDLDALLIDKVLETGRLEPVLDAGITVAEIQGPSRQIFEYLFEYWKNPKYKGALPTGAILNRKFKGYTFEVRKEPLEWIIEEIHKRTQYTLITESMSEVGKALKDFNLDAAREQLFRVNSALSSSNGKVEVRNLKQTAKERQLRYQQRKEGINIHGIPTGFAWLDRTLLGWHSGDMIVLLGKRGVGKTWAALVMAHAAQMAGYNVMFVSKEMSLRSLEERYDSVHAKLPYKDFRRGKLGTLLEKQYYKTLENMESLADFNIPDFQGPCSPATIFAKVVELQIQFLVVDGVYMLDDDHGLKKGWEKHVNIAQDLKTYLHRQRIPGVFTNQLNREADPKDATLDNSAYSDAYGQYSDVALKVMQDSDSRMNKEMIMEALKFREEDLPARPIRVAWDFEAANLGKEAEEEPEVEVAVGY
jgi:RecA/RadA recombinase